MWVVTVLVCATHCADESCAHPADLKFMTELRAYSLVFEFVFLKTKRALLCMFVACRLYLHYSSSESNSSINNCSTGALNQYKGP